MSTPPDKLHSGFDEAPTVSVVASRIIATDDTEVVSVEVAIQMAAGDVVERGGAGKVHGVWLYLAKCDAPAGARLTVTATAKDRPGHAGARTTAVGDDT